MNRLKTARPLTVVLTMALATAAAAQDSPVRRDRINLKNVGMTAYERAWFVSKPDFSSMVALAWRKGVAAPELALIDRTAMQSRYAVRLIKLRASGRIWLAKQAVPTGPEEMKEAEAGSPLRAGLVAAQDAVETMRSLARERFGQFDRLMWLVDSTVDAIAPAGAPGVLLVWSSSDGRGMMLGAQRPARAVELRVEDVSAMDDDETDLHLLTALPQGSAEVVALGGRGVACSSGDDLWFGLKPAWAPIASRLRPPVQARGELWSVPARTLRAHLPMVPELVDAPETADLVVGLVSDDWESPGPRTRQDPLLWLLSRAPSMERRREASER